MTTMARANSTLSLSQGRPRFEATAWRFMRVSGVVILILSFLHILIMHFVVCVENINFQTIVERWTGPLALFWRGYDLALLFFAFTHGMNGARAVLDDYVHGAAARRLINGALLVIYLALLGMGTFIIFTFAPTMPNPFASNY